MPPAPACGGDVKVLVVVLPQSALRYGATWGRMSECSGTRGGVCDDRGDVVQVHYVGVAYSTGEEFDASWDRGEPLAFRLGAGQVIAGWDQGVQGMKVGGRRQLIVPPALAYGDRGAGNVIAPGETLIFVCDLVSA